MWYFRLMALVGVPLLCFGLLESGLRLAGFGYPTAFLLKSSNHGENTFVQNGQFGWRFFGPRAARVPAATSIPREKPPGTVRIFVFGESAAYGDPQPRFGLPRLLEAMLDLRHPGKRFEVVNAAMTGINSHVILPLARDCAEARGDVWVIYMGNNEVVGPFGAGTVFGSQTMPLPLIRAGLALKATRTGQLLDAVRGASEKTAAGNGEWKGMRMFVKYKLAGSDPRLGAVYDNFGHNLKDIIAAGQNSGAKIVLSTVAVNLKDCAPFASLHRPGLSGSQLNDWQRLFDAGATAQAGGDFRQAATDYDQAERIDESYAELRFRRGQCALALHDAGAAQKEFAAARDLDALRFRCDSRLNDLIRQLAQNRVALADGERALAEASPDGIPGADFFYEHVHLTFQGNYVLARAIAEKVEGVLTLPQNAPWPDMAQCAQRLGRTPRDLQAALSVLFGRLGEVPFTFQANHDEQMRRLTEAARELPPPDSAASLRGAQSATEAALARWSDDAMLWEQLGKIKQAEGDYAGAVAAAQRSLDLTPSDEECWLHYGILMAKEERYEEAVAAFKHVLALDPQAVWARLNLATCLEKLGRRDEALVEFKRTLAQKPDYGTAWLSLGQFDEAMGRTNDADQCFHTALTNRVNQADDLAALARFCASRRWLGPAITNYAAAIELEPWDPGLRLEAGRALAVFGRHDEAAQQYQAAVELAPDQALPHMQLGVELGRLRQPALAENEFRQVLRLDPDSIEARADLGVALYEQEKLDEARKQFEDVLQRDPRDATALHYVQLLRNR
ncbi:MAG TPA: tetratricopeptide repeat protein, partial [Candidatus Acidoferrum sp.]|nr:tetratricopeptide repeat protein [Candidatus Acidoferrum sp.]